MSVCVKKIAVVCTVVFAIRDLSIWGKIADQIGPFTHSRRSPRTHLCFLEPFPSPYANADMSAGVRGDGRACQQPSQRGREDLVVPPKRYALNRNVQRLDADKFLLHRFL